MANGTQTAAGTPVVPSTGSVQTIKYGSGTLLGVFADAAGTVIVYDAATPATYTTNNFAIGLTCVQGWNPFPVTFSLGLMCNASPVCIVVVQ